MNLQMIWTWNGHGINNGSSLLFKTKFQMFYSEWTRTELGQSRDGVNKLNKTVLLSAIKQKFEPKKDGILV